MVAPTQVWSQSAGQEGFNPNLLFTAWHIWAVQLHFPLIHWAAWMTVWRETDWRGNGLIVLTLTAGMWTALQNWSFLQGEWKRPSSLLMFRFTYIYQIPEASSQFCVHMSNLCVLRYDCSLCSEEKCQRTTTIYLPKVTQIDRWRVVTDVEKTWDKRVKCFDVHLGRLIHSHQS